MTWTYDISTDAGKVRLLCNDTVSTNQIFSDDEIAAFLVLENGVRRAAALALETIASNEVLVQKVIKILDISTNGAAESSELLKRAALLRSQADEAEISSDGGIDFAEWALDPFGAREIIAGEAMDDD